MKPPRTYSKKQVPQFRIGDTVSVGVKIVEGEKERVQHFIGVVIARKGAGLAETFTVRRIVNNEGVERIFPLHSPSVLDVKVTRSGVVRRAKLFFLRHRVGKARRLRERRVSRSTATPQSASPKPGSEASAGDVENKELAGV